MASVSIGHMRFLIVHLLCCAAGMLQCWKLSTSLLVTGINLLNPVLAFDSMLPNVPIAGVTTFLHLLLQGVRCGLWLWHHNSLCRFPGKPSSQVWVWCCASSCIIEAISKLVVAAVLQPTQSLSMQPCSIHVVDQCSRQHACQSLSSSHHAA